MEITQYLKEIETCELHNIAGLGFMLLMDRNIYGEQFEELRDALAKRYNQIKQ